MKTLVPLLFIVALLLCSVVVSASNNGPSQLFAPKTATGKSSSSSSSPIEEITTVSQITSLIRVRYRASVIVFYDSADLNSWRAKPAIEEGADLLAGFTRVLAADVRNPNITMLRAAWGVSTVPWFYDL